MHMCFPRTLYLPDYFNNMYVFHHPDCLLHNPPYEILSGHIVPYFESPSRTQLIKKALEEDSSSHFNLSDELDFNLDVKEHCLRVHTPDYLQYLESAYADWVKAGGDEVCELLIWIPSIGCFEAINHYIGCCAPRHISSTGHVI